MVLSGVPQKKSLVTPPGIDPGTVRLVAQRLNHYATPGPLTYKTTKFYDEKCWFLDHLTAYQVSRYFSGRFGKIAKIDY